MQSKVSVVIPTYNMSRYVGPAIESLLSQDAGLEIIVVDDGSTDDTRAVLERYPVKYIYQKNHGCCGAGRNTGLRYVTGEYIAFLDADDLACPGRIAAQAKLLDENPGVGAVYTDHRDFRENEAERPNHFAGCPRILKALNGADSTVLARQEARDILLEENFALPSALMIRRSALTHVPGFSLETRIGEDFHFAFSIARHWDIGLIALVGAQRRLHGTNISGDSLLYLQYGVIMRELLRASEPSPLLRRKLALGIKRSQNSLARELANRGEFRESFVHARDIKTFVRTLVLSVIGSAGKKAGGQRVTQ